MANIFDDGLVALGMLGSNFAEHATGKLLAANSCYKEAHYYMLLSAFARKDAKAVRRFLRDWSGRSKQPRIAVSKFIPGDHYHVLDEKFDTLEAATAHLQKHGYVYGGLHEKHVYVKDGD